MSSDRLPEIAALAKLFEELHQTPHGQRAPQAIATLFGAQNGINPDDAWWELMRIVAALPSLSVDLPSLGASRVAKGVVEDLTKIFGPDRLSSDLGTFLSSGLAEINHVRRSLDVFDDLQIDVEIAKSKATDLSKEIETLRGLIARNTDLPDSTRVILFRQMDLAAISLAKFRDGSISPFRESLYTVYGRIIIELEPLKKIDAGAFERIVEQVEKIAPLIEAVSAIAGINAPIISIAGPAAVTAHGGGGKCLLLDTGFDSPCG